MGKIIEIEGVGMVREGKRILSDINLSVNAGDFIAITGPNGGGKTTLLKIILQLLEPTSGTVSYYYESEKVKRLSIGYLPQKNSIDSNFPMTVSQVISSGLLGLKGVDKSRRQTLTEGALRDVELESKANSPIGALSGGQLQRTLLGRAIIAPHDVLVLDEPLSYIDRSFENKIYNLISERAPHTTIILVSHEMTRFAQMANRHIIIDRTLTECHSLSHRVHCDCCE
ncbi:MAG: metal ABC transporter ATP-binding protein [Muribaculaceae bacterium]|nr:metal ABC transporter ATP-binding protein [Muribaculaceae bacterium]